MTRTPAASAAPTAPARAAASAAPTAPARAAASAAPTAPARAAAALAVLTLAACGAPRAAQAQTHRYDLTQSYADANGGPALSPNGGTRSAAGYAFGPNQGPSLSGALSSLSTYSIGLVFSLADNVAGSGSGYQKLIDFQGLASDSGLYDLNGALVFYSAAFPAGTVFTPGQTTNVLLTRDGASRLVTGYANGVQQFQFTDIAGDAVFGSNSILFFQDDTATGGREAGTGLLKSVTIGGPAPAPEPPAPAGLALGAACLAGLTLRARKRRA